MKSNFSQNIRALRKQRRITQEQLAEAMNVTAGAVYKWEQALSTPDLGIIMELASFFNVSVDALVGYQVCASDKERILQELKRIKVEKDYDAYRDEVEKWLKRYPNDFDVVYHSGVLYNLTGIEQGDTDLIQRSITLLQHACRLISQNQDPEISETAIYRDISIATLLLGREQEGLEMLKRHNPCGLNNDLIGLELSTIPLCRTEALPYLSDTLIRCTTSLYRMVIGYLNVFFHQQDYRSALDLLQWMIAYLSGLSTPQGTSYLDKDNALLMTICGAICHKTGDTDGARAYLKQARRTALRFDAAPDYTSRNIRYCQSREPRVAYDNIGQSASDTILNFLSEGISGPDEALSALWEEVCHEA